MELSLILGKRILSMFLIVLVGFGMYRSGKFNRKDTDTLAKINISIVCPCAIFSSFQMTFSMDKLTGLCLAILAALIVHVLFIVLERILRPVFHLTAAESASIIYTNGLNLILPIVAATLGEEMTFYCSAFVLVQTFLMWTHGVMLLSGTNTFRFRSMLNPNILSIFLGLILFLCNLQLPSILGTSVSTIGSMVGPVSMLVIGLLMGPLNLKKAFTTPRGYVICIIRLLVFPIITVFLLRYCGIMSLHANASYILMVTMIAASSCSAAAIPQIAQVYSDEANYASLLNVMTLTFCIVTMPFIILIYQILL